MTPDLSTVHTVLNFISPLETDVPNYYIPYIPYIPNYYIPYIPYIRDHDEIL
jgi:hypothetical protein